MGARRPGTLCGTHAEPIDAGTNCLAASPRPGPIGVSTPKPRPVPVVSFSKLWAGYPGDKPYRDAKGDVPAGYENQCAIKVSVALHAAGAELRGFAGASVPIAGKRVAVRAAELAQWLRLTAIPGIKLPAVAITGADWQQKAKGKTGIVYFADYWLRPGEKSPTGDHIDLWNGSRLTASGLEGTVVTVLRFGLGIDSGPGFSDLGKSSQILLWEIQ